MRHEEPHGPSPLDDLRQGEERELVQFCRWLAKQPNLATALRELRARRDMSLREAAFLAQRSPAYLDRIEHGLRRPERDTLIALCLRAYDLSIRETGRLLLLAEYAPLPHELLATRPPLRALNTPDTMPDAPDAPGADEQAEL